MFGKALAAFFTLALYFGVQSTAAMQALFCTQASRQNILAAIIIYFVGISIGAFLAGRYHHYHGKSRYWFVFILFIAPLIIQLFAHQVLGQWWQFLAMPALMGLYLPLSFYLFYKNMPLRFCGLLLGLAMAIAEFNWLILLPVLNNADNGAPYLLAHINIVQVVLQTGLAVLLAIGWLSSTSQRVGTNGLSPADSGSGSRLIAGMAVCLYLLYGLATSQGFPKLAHSLSVPLHIIFIFVLPLTGWLFDRQALAGANILLWAIAAIMLLGIVMTGTGCMQAMGYIAMSAMRHSFLLLSLLLVVYLNQKRVLFWFCMVYTLQVLSLASAGAGRAMDYPVLGLGLMLALLAGFALQLLKWSAVSKNQANPIELIMPAHMPTDPAQRLDLFARAFNLAPKERVVLSCVIQGWNLEETGRHMQRSVHTVRLHLRRMLKKTGSVNRQNLTEFYQAWFNNDF